LDQNENENEDEDDEDEDEIKKVKLPVDIERAKKQILKIAERIKKWEIKKSEKDELKTIALGTSKINYLDPRITVSWCKFHDIPIDKIFSKTLRDKFPWSLDVERDWKF